MNQSEGFIADAIRDWSESLDVEQVKHDRATIDRYARTTQPDAPRPCCVLYPTTTAEVQEIVRIAGRHGVVVYPISCGKNWGYGDACAPTPNAAIVDLGRMNRILEVHTDLAYCVIEPGVTQKQLFDHLRDNKTGLWMDATAAGPDSSLVGNTVDRGFGHTRYGDHFLTCSGMEIVLADGRVLNTGLGHYPNAKATHLYPYGVGPYMDGIFSQSNLGIVTKIGLWLIPEPEAFNFFYVRAKNFEDFEPLLDALRPLRISGVLQTAIHIGNEFRVIAGSGRFPWEETKGEAPIPAAYREQLRQQRGARAWQGSGSISGSKAHVRASRRALKKALRGIAEVGFVDDRKLALVKRIAGWCKRFGVFESFQGFAKILEPNYELLKGVPTIEPLMGAHWRLRKPPEKLGDPLDSGVGLYWISPVLPMRGRDALDMLRTVEPIFNKHGFDMIVSLILLTERALVAIFNIAFDKNQPGESEAASACYQELVDTLMGMGYPLYRAGLEGMPKMREPDSVYWDVATTLKKALDPKDIIARGRYIAPLEEQSAPESGL